MLTKKKKKKHRNLIYGNKICLKLNTYRLSGKAAWWDYRHLNPTLPDKESISEFQTSVEFKIWENLWYFGGI